MTEHEPMTIYQLLMDRENEASCECCSYISGGWGLLKKNGAIAIGGMLLVFVLLAPASFFGEYWTLMSTPLAILCSAASVLCSLLSYYFACGLFYIMLNVARGEGYIVRCADLFAGFTRFFYHSTVIAICFTLSTGLAVSLIVIIVIYVISFSTASIIIGVGLIILIDFGLLFLMTVFSVAFPTAIEYHEYITPFQAFQISWTLVLRSFGSVIGFYLTVYLLAIFGVMTLIGWIVIFPLIFCSYIFYFSRIVGLKGQFGVRTYDEEI